MVAPTIKQSPKLETEMPEQLGCAQTSGESLIPAQLGRAPAPGGSELWGGEEEKQCHFYAYLWPYVMFLSPLTVGSMEEGAEICLYLGSGWAQRQKIMPAWSSAEDNC